MKRQVHLPLWSLQIMGSGGGLAGCPRLLEFSGLRCRFYGGDLAKAMTNRGDGVLVKGL